jgi:hypothetical protein
MIAKSCTPSSGGKAFAIMKGVREREVSGIPEVAVTTGAALGRRLSLMAVGRREIRAGSSL